MSFTLTFNAAQSSPLYVSGCTFSSFDGGYTFTSGDNPTSLSGFGENAMVGYQHLTGVYNIPNSVTSIGSNAFDQCIALTSITISGNVTLIDTGAFFRLYCSQFSNNSR